MVFHFKLQESTSAKNQFPIIGLDVEDSICEVALSGL
jgi:hypothetical protein